MRCSASVQTIQSNCLADSAFLASSGPRCGQVLGSIPVRRDWGEQPITRPVRFRDVFATLYEWLGIDVATTQFADLVGRP